MDISSSGLKSAKYRTNNTFAFPTSLNTELTFLNISSANHTPDTSRNHTQQTSKRRALPLSSPTDSTTNVSTYQAIEAAYLEHGIRIHLNSTNPTSGSGGVGFVQQENLIRKKPTNNIQRYKTFVNKQSSRSSSALHYSTNIQDTNQDSRPFSALQHTSIVDFEEINTPKETYAQPIETQNQLESSPLLHQNRSSSPILPNQHFDHFKLPITNGISTTTFINHDPDLAYMTSLLQTTNGDSFRGKFI